MGGRERRIIVGLGNPGERYRDTRHNVGFWFIDYLAHRWNFPIFGLEDNVLLSDGTYKDVGVVLAKPTTYMNRSGLAMATLSRIFDYEKGDLLVCHDDLDIPVGRFKLKPAGGAAGHRGVRSVLEYMGGDDVGRLKFGILPPERPEDMESFVLSSFGEEEEKMILDLFPRAERSVGCILLEGIDKAMSLYNCEPLDTIDQGE